MGHAYQAVGWNRQKRIYDATLAAAVLVYLLLFVGLGLALNPETTVETQLIRGLGTAAFLALHVVLCIGPLCRLDPRLLPLLYNRRHLGVATFLLGLAHGMFALVQFHAQGDVSPLVSLLASDTRFDSLSQFPFQPLGFLALVVLFLMAATSHDFWLANLTAPVWKALHMLVYAGYALVVLHVALGVLQAETSPVYPVVLGLGLALVLGLHVAAGLRERRADRPVDRGASEFVDACALDDIAEGRARAFVIAGERVAVFRYDGKVSALSAVCQHQNGPLGEGRVIDGLVTCPWHGYQYRPACGRSPEPFQEKVPTFRVRIEQGRVLVDPQPLPAGTPVEPAIASPAAKEPADGDFYVGYLGRAPGALARWLQPRLLALFALVAALATVLTAAQRPFADAVFEYGETRSFEGWIASDPCPTLLVERPGKPGYLPRVSRYLLVARGKHGAERDAAAFDRQHVRLMGSLVHRDGKTMIEIAPGTIAPTGRDARPEPDSEPWSEDLGMHTLIGEIVDSKCFLGVMKPGNAQTHRACATRCISGGIPPVLLVRRSDGTALYLVLTAADGSSVNSRVLDKIAEPVEITGQVLRYDDLLVLRADPETYQRIP